MITDENSTAVNSANPDISVSENLKETCSNSLESKVFQQDGNQDCLNMGSNGQIQNSMKEDEEQPAADCEMHQTNQENMPVNAEYITTEDNENEKLRENDHKNSCTESNAHLNIGFASDKPLQCIEHQSNENINCNAQEVHNHNVNTSEYSTNMRETHSNEVNTNFIQNLNMEVKDDPNNLDDNAELQNISLSSPNKNGAFQNDDPEVKNLNSSNRKQNLPKRVLRDRKLKMIRGADSSSKCHLCEKNSLRCTLIPCSKGAEDCEIYFCNICIKKFNQSLSEDDYYNGIECPVCQGICSCEKCKKSVLEEDFKKIMESMHALEDSRKTNQLITQNKEEGATVEVKETNVNSYQESSNYGHYAGMCTIAQDGVRSNTMTLDSKYHLPIQTYTNQTNYQVDSNMDIEDKIKSRNLNMDTEDDNRWAQSRLPEIMDMQDNEEESNPDKNQDESSYSRSTKQQLPAKKKRGRKRKIREDFDASSESEPDMFNYDRFIKKVSKKGTRVHVNVRMFALRTNVPGTKAQTQTIPKMAMGMKDENKEIVASNQIQKYPKNKINEIRKQASETLKHSIISEIPKIEKKEPLVKQNYTTSNYQKQNEDIYNDDNLNMGRYNLRKRGPQKKYYDDGDFEDEQEFEPRRKSNYLDDYKQASKPSYFGAGTAVNRRAPVNDSQFQNKQKRKKKDDDEDYIEEDENDDEKDDFSQSKNKQKDRKPIMQTDNSFNPQNTPQMGYVPQNVIPNKFQLPQTQGQFQNQGKFPSYPPTMPNNMPSYMGSNMQGGVPQIPSLMSMQNMQSIPNMPNIQGMMPSTNSMAYMMNAQNRATPPPDNSKVMNFSKGMPPITHPMQQPNMGYMMRMDMMPSGMQGMSMQQMPGVFFQQQNQMMRPGDNQNMNRMYGNQNFQNKFQGGMGPNKF